MNLLETSLILLLAILHLWFMILEMFLWTKPIGMKIFGNNPDFAKASAVLAKNQGLYNGLLAAALVISFFVSGEQSSILKLYGVGAIVIAGIYGGFTANRKIWFVQALPAIITLGILIANRA